MTDPTFFIVGAQKAGTTSLYAMLAQHPDVFMPEVKEPGYFIRGFDDPERWQTLMRPEGGDEPVALAGVRRGVFTAQEYASLFSSGQARAARHRGEASTPYLPSPYAAARIARQVPDARIIIALRDPVTRAYSAWGHNRARGNENCASFEDAVEHELAGKRDNWIWGSRYLYSGLYSIHVQRYLDAFPADQVLILKFEDFRGQETQTLDKICAFLDLPSVAIEKGRQENPTVHHVNPLLAGMRSAFTSPGAAKSTAKLLLPRGLRNRVRRGAMGAIDRFGDKPAPMSAEVEGTLADYFAADCAKLKSMVDFDIGDWLPC